MARRFIDEEENKKKRKPAASPSSSAQSIKRQVQNTVRSMGNNRQANSVKSSQRNNTKAFQTANVRREANQKKRESSFTPQVQTPQTSWSPVTDPVKDYFAPVPETPKRVPNQWMPVSNPELDYNPAPTYVPQSTKDIAADYFLPAPINPEPVQPTMPQDIPNAVYNGTGDFLNPYAQQAQINKTGQFVNQSGALIGSGMDRWTGNVAYGIGDIGLIGAQNYNANRVNDRTNEAGIPVEWLTEANTDPDYWRRNAIYQAAMADAARLGDNELANTTWGQLMQNLGYNLPGAVSAFATGPLGPWAQRAANMIPMAIGAYGAGLDEKSAEGYEDKFARRYGLLNALNETVFQESIDPFHATFGMPMTLQNMAGEFLQEAAGQAVEPYMNLALRDYENPQEFWDAFWATTENEVLTPENAAAALEAGKMGALGAGINAMATNPVGTIQQAQQDVDIARDVFTDEYVDLKNDLENQIKNLDAYDSPIAEDYQNAMREQVEGLRRNITNRNSDVYTDMMGGIKEQIEFLDSVGTPEAQRTKDVYRSQLERTRDEILQPGALASQNPMIQDAAKAANRDRVLDQAKQYGIREDVADAMASIANDRQIRLNLFESDDPGDQAHHGTGENADLVEISSKADDPIGELFSHEFTHDIEGSDLYGEHRNSVYDLYDRGIIKDSTFADINAVRNAVRNAYGSDKSDEYIEREVTAYATQKLFSDEDAIIALAQENPGLARRVYDSIRETISNGFGATEEELAARDKMNSIRRARDLFKRALETPQTFSLYYDDDDKEKNARELSELERYRVSKERRSNKILTEQFRDLTTTNKTGQAFERIGSRLKFGDINSNYAFIDYNHLMHYRKHNATQKEAADKIHAAVQNPALIIDHLTDKDLTEIELLKGDSREGKGVFFEYRGKPHVMGVGHRYNEDLGEYIDTITSVYELDSKNPLSKRIKKWIADGRKVYTNNASSAFLSKFAPEVSAEDLARGKKNKGYKFSKNLTEDSDVNKLSLTPEMKEAVEAVKSAYGLEHLDDNSLAEVISEVGGPNLSDVYDYGSDVDNYLAEQIGGFIKSYNYDYDNYDDYTIYRKALEYLDQVTGEVMSLDTMYETLDDKHFLPWLKNELGIKNHPSGFGWDDEADYVKPMKELGFPASSSSLFVRQVKETDGFDNFDDADIKYAILQTARQYNKTFFDPEDPIFGLALQARNRLENDVIDIFEDEDFADKAGYYENIEGPELMTKLFQFSEETGNKLSLEALETGNLGAKFAEWFYTKRQELAEKFPNVDGPIIYDLEDIVTKIKTSPSEFVYSIADEETLIRKMLGVLEEQGVDLSDYPSYYDDESHESYDYSDWKIVLYDSLVDELINSLRLTDEIGDQLVEFSNPNVLDFIKDYFVQSGKRSVNWDKLDSIFESNEFIDWANERLGHVISSGNPGAVDSALEYIIANNPELKPLMRSGLESLLISLSHDSMYFDDRPEEWAGYYVSYLPGLAQDILENHDSAFSPISQDKLFGSLLTFASEHPGTVDLSEDNSQWVSDFTKWAEENELIYNVTEADWDRVYGPEPPRQYREDGTPKNFYYARNVDASAIPNIVYRGGESMPSYAGVFEDLQNSFRLDGQTATFIARPEAFAPEADPGNLTYPLDIWSPDYVGHPASRDEVDRFIKALNDNPENAEELRQAHHAEQEEILNKELKKQRSRGRLKNAQSKTKRHLYETKYVATGYSEPFKTEKEMLDAAKRQITFNEEYEPWRPFGREWLSALNDLETDISIPLNFSNQQTRWDKEVEPVLWDYIYRNEHSLDELTKVLRNNPATSAVSDKTIKRIHEALEMSKTLPTDMFENNNDRIVHNREIAQAYVPYEVEKKYLDELRNQGVEVYKFRDLQDQEKLIKRYAKKYMLSKNLKKIGVKEALARNPKRIHVPSANDFRADGSIKNLIVSHNFPMSMVRKMWENGGVVAPSLAINLITDNNQFGSPTDASAIGTKALVDPADPNNLTTRFDSWTARFPEAHYSFNKDAFIQTGTYLENLDGMGAAAYMDSVLEAFMSDDKKKFDKFMNVLKTYGGYELFKDNSVMQAVYLLNSNMLSDKERKTLENYLYYDMEPAQAEDIRQAHIVQNSEGKGRYDEWLHLLFDDVTYGKQKLLDPTTGKYKSYSLENALKIMRKQPRTLANTEEMLNPPWSEDYGNTDVPIYQQASGFNAIMGAYGGKFNSLQEIVDARGSLQTERDEGYSHFSADYEAAMTPLIGEMHDNYAKGASVDEELGLYEESDRAFGEAFLKFVRGEDHSVAKLKSLMGRKLAKCVSEEKIQKVIDVLEEAKKTLKTDLFESKPDRIVTPDEFPQLVLPASELTEQDYEWAKKYNQEIIAFDDTKDAKGPNSRDRMKMRYAQDNLFSKNIKKSVDKQTADMPKDQSLDNLKAAVQEEAEQAINRTARRMAEGEGAGLYQNVSEDTAQRVSEQVADKATNVTYDKTKLDALSTSANSRLDKMGLEEFMRRAYDTADEISGNQQMERTNNPFKNAVNRINNDIRLHSNIADLSLIAQELENRKTQFIDEAEKKGYKFETYTTSDGKYEVRLTSKSKHDEAGQTYMTNINALNEELDNALLKLDTVGHNMGVGLREFGMFEKMSPARQLQSLEKTIEKMNRQLHKEFGGYFNGKIFNKFKNGTFEDIVLTEEFKQKYRKAKTQEERAKLIEEFGRDVAKNFPSTLGEKVSAWRYLMMLGNPVTWERNFGGNLMEQGAVSMKNGMYYLIEKALQAGGFVGKNNIDRNNAKDQRLIRYAEKNAFDTLYNDYAEFRQTKGVSQEAFFRQKGYTGALLKWLSSYKGSNLSMSSQQKLLENLNYNVASALKDQGIKITNKGALTKDADFRKIINGAYNGANRMIMRESDLRHVNAEGGYARLSGEETKALENFFNTDKWLQEQQGNKWFDKPTGRGLEYAFNKERQEHVFGRGKVGEAVNAANNATNYMLNDSFMGDTAFTRFRFARTMGSLLNAQGYGITTSKKGEIYLTKGNRTLSAEETKQVLDEYKGEALQEAKESVYRNFNAVAQWINKGRRVPGLGLILDAVMPFTTTPMNIVSQAVQYSPAGLLYALNDYNGLSSGERTPQQFINHLAKSFTGSALMGVGYLLSQLGALRGFNDDDDKEKKYKKQLGWQDYSLVWNHNGKEHSYTVDWLAPGITPLLMGAAINETLEANGGQVESDEMLFSLFESLYQPIADTTMLEGLMNTFSAFGEKHPIREAGKALITSYAGQFTPTLGARLNKIFDDTARTTYSSNFYENILLQAENKLFLTNLAYKQITGEALLEPQLNAKGEEVKNTGFFGGGTLGRALYNLGSPGKYSTNTADNYDNELLRLYESKEITTSAKNNILPSQLYSIDGESLKPGERTELNKYFLQNYRGQLEKYMDSPMYTAADDATRAKMLSSLKDYYEAKTKERYYGTVSPDSGNVLNKSQKAVSELEKMGIAPYQSLAYSTIKSDTNADGDTIKNSKALKVRQVMELEGNYDTVLGLIKDGKIAPGDVGLNKTVVEMDRSTFTDSYDALADGMYTGNSTDSDGASPAKEAKETATKYSTKKTSSGRKTRTSSGRRRSGGSSRSTTTDMDKLYQKLYKMAMSGTLDSIGDLASQFSKQAQATYGPKREQTNHEALISELEKMVAQQKKRPN